MSTSAYFSSSVEQPIKGLKGLKELRSKLHSTSPPDSSPLQKPEIIPRRKKSPPPSIDEPATRPRPSSFHGEDSLKAYELRLYGSSASTREERPVPKPRTQNLPDNFIPPRQRIHSKGSKEYRANKKELKLPPTAVSPSPVLYSDPFNDPSSPTYILDLDTCPSIRRAYNIDNEEEKTIDISAVSGHSWERDQHTVHSPVVEFSQLTFNDNSVSTAQEPEKKTPPPKPKRNRKVSPNAVTPPMSPPDSDKESTPPPIITHSQSNSNISTASSKSKSKGIIGALKRSPLFKRKSSKDVSAGDDFQFTDNESIISEIGVIKPSLSPLHKTSVKSLNDLLKDPKLDPNCRDDDGYTPLHWYVQKPRRHRNSLALKCLQSNRHFDVNAKDRFDNTPLHLAAMKNDIQYAKILIAFGANVHSTNFQNKLPKDLCRPHTELYNLLNQFPQPLANDVGPLASLPDELNSMNVDELRNETIGRLMSPDRMPVLSRMIDHEVKCLESSMYNDPDDGYDLPSLTQHTAEQSSVLLCLHDQNYYLKRWKSTAGNRVLFLDGGGIRGLVQVEILMELEKRTGRRITELFDWIVGTSTGGLVALSLVYGNKSLLQIKEIYFKLKNHVFAGSGLAGTFLNMAAKSRNLEEILKRELGNTLLSSIQKPRVMVCAVNKEIIPLQVQFFNNFMKNKPELTEVPLWEVARATTAAPIYFTPFRGKYVDGGVKANNPCEFAMAEINRYDHSMGLPQRNYLLTVSLGTGIYPDKVLETGGKGIQLHKMFTDLVDMLTDAISDSESAAHKFSLWCKNWSDPIPFFRFNPQLDEVVSPGEIDDFKIVELILKTKLYLAQKDVSESMDKLVQLFRRLAKQSSN